MGNRGILHDGDGHLGTARWRHKAWICCELSFKGRHRTVMDPGRYTELFFLDEAVALAAGHRPCAECRRADWLAFREAFGRDLSASEIDRTLHEDRVEARSRRQIRHRCLLADLADGAMFLWQGRPHLVRDRVLHPFTPAGYDRPIARPVGQTVEVLTPVSTLRALERGFQPRLHPSVTP